MKTIIFSLTILFGITLNINAQIPTNGLVGYWPFNGNANDESGNGNDGVNYGATITLDRFGNENSAYYFDGVDDLIRGQNVGFNLPIGSQSRTLNAWVKFEGGTPNYGPDVNIYQYGTDGSNAVTYHLFVHIDDTMAHAGIGNGYGYGTIIDTLDLHDSEWHLITGVYSGLPDDSLFIFIDSKLSSKDKISNTPNTTLSDNWIIGKFMANAGYLKGNIDDIRIYNRVLNTDEISALYNESIDSVTSISEYHISNADFKLISPKIFPNPAMDVIYITGNEDNQMTDLKIKIINMKGSIIFESNMTEQLYVIDVNRIGQTGLFFIQIIDNTNNIIEVEKIIIE